MFQPRKSATSKGALGHRRFSWSSILAPTCEWDAAMKRRKASVRAKIPHRNYSPYGRWIASYIEWPTWDDAPAPSPNSRRCHAWENTIILRARNREGAYKNAVKLGSNNVSTFWDKRNRKRTGRWEFLGLTSLLPIYQKLEDGAEILGDAPQLTPHGDVGYLAWTGRYRCFRNLNYFCDLVGNAEIL